MKMSTSTSTYVGLVIALAFLAVANVFLPQGSFLPSLPQQELPASNPVLAVVSAAIVLVFYGGLGYLGLRLSLRLGFADLWDSSLSNRQRFLIPAVVGVGLGAFFIIADIAFRQASSSDPLPHPPFPTSLVASASAGIGEEIIFRLFFIPFGVWLVSHAILRRRWQNQVFWAVSVLSAITFAAAHIPSMMIVLGFEAISEMPAGLMAEIVLLNGVLSLFAAHYLRRYGFLAPVGIHFWTDIVWHVVWGLA
jgi:hypothetical protein